ncbi:MAG TPA: D-alanyl-D-alanine carboxypeptidase [Sphingobacteriaceae bacterium]
MTTKALNHSYGCTLLTAFLILMLTIPAEAQRLTGRKIKRILEQSEVTGEHYTGFMVVDQETNKILFDLNGNRPSVPASNTKLFTFYTALQMLSDPIPGLRYIRRGDSLIFWGTGDPSMLHSELRSTKVYDFLKASPHKLFFSSSNQKSNREVYGSSPYEIQPSSLPVAENNAVVFTDASGKLLIKPSFLQSYLKPDSSFKPRTFTVRRHDLENTFTYPLMPVPSNYRRIIPLKLNADLTRALLQDTLRRTVELIDLPVPDSASTLYSVHADSLYRQMMLPSDNYIAEQLLMLCSSALPGGTLSIDSAIAYSRKNFLSDMPDKFQWRDGSGLSRYNLFTPRTIIALLVRIKDKIGDEERLHNLFPAGGVNGTLRNAYKTDNGVPFVWAKTGTLSNVHIQGGYLVTRKGRKLLYSFMNNNFLRPTADIRAEMVRVMTEIHNRF